MSCYEREFPESASVLMIKGVNHKLIMADHVLDQIVIAEFNMNEMREYKRRK